MAFPPQSTQATLPTGVSAGWNDPPSLNLSSSGSANRLNQMRRRPVDPSINNSPQQQQFGGMSGYQSSPGVPQQTAQYQSPPQPQHAGYPPPATAQPQGQGQPYPNSAFGTPSRPHITYPPQPQPITPQAQPSYGVAYPQQAGGDFNNSIPPSTQSVSPFGAGIGAADTMIQQPMSQQGHQLQSPSLYQASSSSMPSAHGETQFNNAYRNFTVGQEASTTTKSSDPFVVQLRPPETSTDKTPTTQQFSQPLGMTAWSEASMSNYNPSAFPGLFPPPSQSSYSMRPTVVPQVDTAEHPPNFVARYDELESWYFDFRGWVDPVKAPGDVDFSNERMIKLLRKFSLWIPTEKCKFIQKEINEFESLMESGTMSAYLLKKMCYVIDFLDQKKYSDAREAFNRLVCDHPEECLNGTWYRALSVLIEELIGGLPLDVESAGDYLRKHNIISDSTGGSTRGPKLFR